MAAYGRVLTRWVGGPSSPGLTVMNFRRNTGSYTDAVTAVRAFWAALASYLPTAYTLTVDPLVEEHESSDGSITGTWTAGTAPADVVGTGATAWAAGVGFRVTWDTGAVVNGHRVKGRTFIIPVLPANYDSSGTIAAATITAVNTAATNLRTAASGGSTPLVIYTKAGPRGPGALTDVSTGVVPDQVAVLRGRRVA